MRTEKRKKFSCRKKFLYYYSPFHKGMVEAVKYFNKKERRQLRRREVDMSLRNGVEVKGVHVSLCAQTSF